MRIFIEVTESGEWNDDLSDYDFEEVDSPTFFAVDQIQWFQVQEDCVIFGVIGYEMAFKTETTAFDDAKKAIGCIRIRNEGD